MYPIDKRQSVFLCHTGSGFICQQHHFFNDAFALATGARLNINTNAICIQENFALWRFNFRSTPLFSQAKPLVAEFVQQRQHIQYFCIFFLQCSIGSAIQQSVDFFINALDLGTNDTLPERIRTKYPLIVQFHDGRKGKPVFLRIQRTNPVGKCFRQHWHNLIGIVQTCPPFQCFFVECRMRLDIVGNIGNMHAEPITIRNSFHGNSIVQILGFCTINCKNAGIPQI